MKASRPRLDDMIIVSIARGPVLAGRLAGAVLVSSPLRAGRRAARVLPAETCARWAGRARRLRTCIGLIFWDLNDAKRARSARSGAGFSEVSPARSHLQRTMRRAPLAVQLALTVVYKTSA